MSSESGRDSGTRALGRQAARGGAVTLLGQVARILLQVASIVVLARLLGPAEYGLVAMVTAITGFATIVQDFGLSRAAIQARSLTDGQRDNLFWLNLAFGLVAGCVVFAAAPAIASVYGEPLLVEITRWLAITFVMGGAAAQFRAGLLRDLRFSATATTDVLATLIGFVVAVVVAATGGGHWALVAQQVVMAGMTALGAVVAARWLPGLPNRRESVRSFVSYGAHFIGAQALTYASSNVDIVVIGARFGAAATGIYNRSFQMMMLPIRQLSGPAAKVAMPVLSRLQDDEEQYTRFLVRGQTIVLNTIIPFLALAAAVAGPVVEIVLGTSWAGVVPLFTILAVGGAFQVAGFAANWVLMSTGNSKAQLQFALVARPLVIVAVLVGSIWGVTGVAAGYATMLALIWPAWVWWAGRASGMSARTWFLNGLRALVAHCGAAAVAGAAHRLLDVPNPWAAVGVGLGVMLVVLSIEALLWPAFRSDLRQYGKTGELLGARRPRRAPAASEPADVG